MKTIIHVYSTAENILPIQLILKFCYSFSHFEGRCKISRFGACSSFSYRRRATIGRRTAARSYNARAGTVLKTSVYKQTALLKFYTPLHFYYSYSFLLRVMYSSGTSFIFK